MEQLHIHLTSNEQNLKYSIFLYEWIASEIDKNPLTISFQLDLNVGF